MLIKYLEVIKDGLSIELDSDIHYYHHFKVGEIITVEINKDSMVLASIVTILFDINQSIGVYGRNLLKINWDSIKSESLSINDSIDRGYLIDITKNVDRNKKLELLGI